MFMRKKEKTKTNNKNYAKKSHLILIGSLLIILGFSIVGGKYIYKYISYKEETKIIEEFLDTEVEEITIENVIEETPEEPVKEEKKENYNYIAVLEIPTINLKKGLLDIDDKNNNVDKNIEILKGSSMPDQGGNLILAAHNGLGRVAYFRNLHKLSILD